MSQVTDAGIDDNSHVFFVTGDRVAIYDAGNPGSHWKILKALKAHGIPRERVSVIVISHAHFDHYGSLRALKDELGVPVLAGLPDADYLAKGENVPAENFSGRQAVGRPMADAVKADVVVTGDISLVSYGIEARVITTPGHTVGSLSVLASNGDCATGDFLASLYTADRASMAGTLKKLADGGAKCFYPAHGPRVKASVLFSEFNIV
jgi:glyoxylase-like metal-dependent hydrolase (beta-lactamase superfamily II)